METKTTALLSILGLVAVAAVLVVELTPARDDSPPLENPARLYPQVEPESSKGKESPTPPLLERASPLGAVAQLQGETPDPEVLSPQPQGGELIPRSPYEREAFIRHVLGPAPEQLVPLCFTTLAKKYRSKLPPNLGGEELRAAEVAVERVVKQEFIFRLERNEALKRYVRTAGDLSRPDRKRGQSGLSGTMTHGADRDPAWGGPRTVKVHFYLAYEEYPELALAVANRRTAQQELEALQRR